jgi:uncharacterized SAM-binding protein YcdF (DUF218 family)
LSIVPLPGNILIFDGYQVGTGKTKERPPLDFLLFFLKKLLGSLMLPLGLFTLLTLCGIIEWIRRYRSPKGPLIMVVASILLIILSLPVTGNLLLRPLENRAGPPADPSELAGKEIKFIVVLGGGYSKSDYTVSDRLGESSLKRLLEGIRLWQANRNAVLVVSGGSPSEDRACGQGMAILAGRFGVPADKIYKELDSWDTDDQARALYPLLKGHRFALVTSANHMGRSLMLFRRVGLNPIPAPADFIYDLSPHPQFRDFLPSADGLSKSQTAFYEYLGRMFYRLKHVFKDTVHADVSSTHRRDTPSRMINT